MKKIQKYDKIKGNDDTNNKDFIMTSNSNSLILATLTRAATAKDFNNCTIPVQLGFIGEKLVAIPLRCNTETASQTADGLLTIPSDVKQYPAGSVVEIKLLRPLEDFHRSLIMIGSHDPLYDVIAQILSKNDTSFALKTSHVGSIGGIMAVRRSEAHMAGIHLLDEKDGSYNTAFVKKYFPNGGVRVVECVGRVQGIMTVQGNPKQISGISSLKNSDIPYINRQKGSGTRILFDYLLKKEGIHFSEIAGYDHEEFTHTEVALQIAQGLADAGMGIYSAASLYGLDFIPICNEQYDLLIPDHAWETEMVQEFLNILKSREFAQKLTEMGGYTLENPGEVRYQL